MNGHLRLGFLAIALLALFSIGAASVATLCQTALSDEVERNQLLASILRHEEFIARCMADRGFEYVAWVDPYADGTEAQQATAPEKALLSVNPNDAFVTEMTDEEFKAYEAALWGPDSDRFGDLSPLSGGCLAMAFQEAYGAPPEVVLADQNEAARAISEAVVGDPRLAEADRAWTQCMRDAGYDTSGRRSFLDALWAEEEALVKQATHDGLEPTKSPEWSRYMARRESSLEAEHECAKTHYWPVEESVTAEYVSLFWPKD